MTFGKIAAAALTLGTMAVPAFAQEYYPPAPPPPSVPQGHYETRYVQRWVPGFATRSFVPGGCWQRGWHRVCRPGGYVRQWVPGHYESVPQQVWVQGYGYGY